MEFWNDSWRRKCAVCGKEFFPMSGQQKNCSDSCKKQYPFLGKSSKIFYKNCGICNSLFVSNMPNATYCKENNCREIALSIGKSSKVFFNDCIVCKNRFATNQPHTSFCSDRCRANNYETYKSTTGMSTKIYIKECDICSKLFVSRSSTAKYCDNECKAEAVRRYSKEHSKRKRENVAHTSREQYVHDKVRALIETATNPNNWSDINYFNIGGFTDTVKDQVKERDYYQCQICGFESFLEVHHIVSRKCGGSHKLENLITLCSSCHRAVETKDIPHATAKCLKNIQKNSNAVLKPDYYEKYWKLQSNMSSLFNEINRLLDDGHAKNEILVMLNTLID